MRKMLIAIVTVLAVGCTEVPVSVQQGASSSCENEGTPVTTPSGARTCLYRPIVIETGFRCPIYLANRFDFRHFSLCSSKTYLPPRDLDYLHHYFDVPSDEPWDAVPEKESEAAVDIMWVIDNSGSFCQEQRQIREGFDAFAEALARENVDFHVAVTTTQMSADYTLDPVAKPGHFQSQPQPLPGFDPTCINRLDAQGEPIEGDYSPVREAIELAVSCMKQPEPEKYTFSDLEIECAIERHADCQFRNKSCEGNCDAADLFPPATAYREIPKVLRARDYRDEAGAIDVSRLRGDFGCASMVGTRGHGFEKGLDAALLAVSPEMTGGTVEHPVMTRAPNHGFLRDDARLAVVFASDENDCSHDGALVETSTCGSNICDYATSPDWEGPSPLVPIETMRDQLLELLSASKGRTVPARDVIVANVVGRSSPYAGPVPTTDLCAAGHAVASEPTCVSESGSAFSGDRYDAFARSFPLANVYPPADYDAPDTPLPGLLCSGDPLAYHIDRLGTFIATRP